ncbi:MAG: CoA transferase, partial [Actinomycetota bacterium]
VVKVESSVRPDMFRFWGGADDSPLFHFSNRSKLGVDLNLKDPDQRGAFLELVAGADAVIENFRRGVLERLDLGFDDLRAVNPRIVLGSVSGQGLDGPRADHTTFGSTLEAASGFSAMTVGTSGVPVVSGPNLNFPDQTVCLFAGAVLAAAVTRSRATGTAFHLDVSQRDVAVYAAGPLVEQSARGVAPRVWATHVGRQGTWVAAAADGGTEVEALDGAGVLASCLRDGSCAIVRAPHGELVKGFPFRFSHRESVIGGPAPGIGEHDDLILRKDAS